MVAHVRAVMGGEEVVLVRLCERGYLVTGTSHQAEQIGGAGALDRPRVPSANCLSINLMSR